MDKFADNRKKPKIPYILLAIALLLIQPLLVHLFLKIPAPFTFLERYWNAGDLITYITGFEAFVGTVILGLSSVSINKQMLLNEEKRDALERISSLYISTHTITFEGRLENESPLNEAFCPEYFASTNRGEIASITLTLVNSSKFPLSIGIDRFSVLGESSEVIYQHYMNTRTLSKAYPFIIPPFGTKEVALKCKIDVKLVPTIKHCVLSIEVCNSIGDMYNVSIEFMIYIQDNETIKLMNFQYFPKLSQ